MFTHYREYRALQEADEDGLRYQRTLPVVAPKGFLDDGKSRRRAQTAVSVTASVLRWQAEAGMTSWVQNRGNMQESSKL